MMRFGLLMISLAWLVACSGDEPGAGGDVQDGMALEDVGFDAEIGSDAGSDLDSGAVFDAANADDAVQDDDGDLAEDVAADTDQEADVDAGLAWEEGESAGRAFFVWQGFDHEWLRQVAGFRVPHRISKFDSYISGERHEVEGGLWSGDAFFRMGQSTGVDGNFMRPQGIWGAAYVPGAGIVRGDRRLQWTDDGDGGEYPKAVSGQRERVSVDLSGEAMGGGAWPEYAMVLRGVELNLECDDDLQPEDEPCNSNGMWPYRFRVALEGCQREAQTLSCDLVVEVGRAWTPNLGGLPPLETKPFNDRLGFDMKVHYTVIGGPAEAFRVVQVPAASFSGMLKDDEPGEAVAAVEGTPGFPAAVVALTELGFELSPHREEERYQHLGRYIGALNFGVTLLGYDSDSGQARVGSQGRVWVPDTVANSNIDYEMRSMVLQFGPGSVAVGGQSVEGNLCANSDGAPFFSVWRRCGEDETGPEQVEDAEAIGVQLTRE